jgi:hypothetical protein
MVSQVVQQAIKRAIVSGNFSPLYNSFADDAELRMAMTAGSSISNERGQRSVVARLRSLVEGDLSPANEAPEFFADGERIVAYWDEIVSLRSGMAIRDQCTLVFDVRDGLIIRLAINHDLSPASADTFERRTGSTAASAVNLAGRDQETGSRAG